MTIRRSVKPIPVNACVLLGYPHISLHLHGISCDILMYCMHWQSGAAHVWMHRVGVRGLQGSYEGKMLPFQDAQAHLSWRESAGEKKDELGYPLFLSFQSQSERDNLFNLNQKGIT